MKVVKPFDDVRCVSHILGKGPRHWQDQYEFMGARVPQSVRKLLEVLECIKMSFPADKECNRCCGSVRSQDFSKRMMSYLIK